MTLLLSDEEVRDLLTVEMCLESLEKAYKDLGQGWAMSGSRCDLITANPHTDNQEPCHGLKSMTGTVADFKVSAIRINSDILTWPSSDHGVKRVKVPKAPGTRYVGLVLLFSLETGELLSIYPDASIQRMRVATTSALGAKYLARQKARSLGIFGSGWQAGAHVMASTKVRDVEVIRVYSPNVDRCRKFCDEMRTIVKCEVLAVNTPEDIMRNSDMVMACTNSMDHVVLGKWIRKGMHLSSVKPGELDQEAYNRSDVVVLHTHQLNPVYFLANGKQDVPPFMIKERESFMLEMFKAMNWENLPLLSDVICGKAAGRISEDQITCFSNNLGTGMQFAAVGHAVYQKAKKEKKGKDLPSEWFSQLHHP